MPEILGKDTAFHYTWGGDCDAWALLESKGLRIVQERMPPNRSEVMHRHERAQQLFFVLAGTLTMVLDGEDAVRIGARRALNVPSGTRHQARNDGEAAVEFLVVAQPSTERDRFE